MIFEHRHFADKVARSGFKKNIAPRRPAQDRDLDQPVLDQVHAIPGIAFLEDLLAGCESELLRDLPDALQVLRR